MILIREAEISDAPALHQFLHQLMTEVGHSPIYPREFKRTVAEQEGILKTFKSEPNSICLIATLDGAIVGEINLKGYQRQALRHGTFLGMSVAAAHRRKGLGQELVRHALEWAAANAIERVDLTVLASNEGAIKLYIKNGFLQEGKRKTFVKLPGGYMDDILMVKFLSQAV
jgi:RimJ/RimL family protein N-acetyltransferase